MRTRLLSAIENHARISSEDLAAIACTTPEEVELELDKLESEKVICGYHTLINWDKVGEERADALIEVKVTPQKGVGFDQMAERIYKLPDVTDMFLISGSCDFVIFISGKSMREIAMFVSEQLSTIDGVLSTTTQFILKKYKQDGFIVEKAAKDERLELA
ncbi:MAG: Lrp/AsnC family transcriptional regulator [Eubacteriales bacterium]|nr:Lrp/AsnC family transcriptional regulator [Eubacteriales bacterium]